MNPGDAPRFGPHVIPARQLTDLARQVGELQGLRVEPPLELEQTAAGPMLRLHGVAPILMRLDAQADAPPSPPGAPKPNQWSWTEMLGRADGQVVERPGGLKGGTTYQYAVPVDPASGKANALGVGYYLGDYWEWVPGAGSGDTAYVTPVEADVEEGRVRAFVRSPQEGLSDRWKWGDPVWLYAANGEVLLPWWNYLAHVNTDKFQGTAPEPRAQWATFCCPPGNPSPSGGPTGPPPGNPPPAWARVYLGCCPGMRFSDRVTCYLTRISGNPLQWVCDLNGATLTLKYARDIWLGNSPPFECPNADGWWTGSITYSTPPFAGTPFLKPIPVGGPCAGLADTHPPALAVRFFCTGSPGTTAARNWYVQVTIHLWDSGIGRYVSAGEIRSTTEFGSCVPSPNAWTCASSDPANPVNGSVSAVFGNVGSPVFPLLITPGGPCPWPLYPTGQGPRDWYTVRVVG